MTGKELLDAGELSSAIAQVGGELKADPGDPQKRTFLFELLCCAGDLDRAAKQLDVLGQENADAEVAVQPFRNVLEGEKKRRLLFTEGRMPGLPKSVPAYTRLHLEAINRIRECHYEEARALLEEAEAARPPVRGTINGEQFDDLKDADDAIGPFLEIITLNNYSWVPWEAVRSVAIQPPRHLRDLVWARAEVELNIGPLGEVFIPVLYAQTYLHQDDRVRLGRMTDWRSDVAGLALGEGQRLLIAGARDWPLLSVRELELESLIGEDGNPGADQ